MRLSDPDRLSVPSGKRADFPRPPFYNELFALWGLEQGEVFVPQTVLALRRISWCCTWAAVLCLPVGIWIYLPFAFLAVAAGFMALLVRVLQNAFAQAVRMKDELDYTV